jgi:pimeloyl-ACP methyl ester carboxylesterase
MSGQQRTTGKSERRTTRRAGCEIVYETTGEGTPLLLSHPLYTNRGLWTLFHFVEQLAHRYRIIVYDSIGHGESQKSYDVARYAQTERAADAVAVLDALGIERAHGVGYSMGAWTMGGVAALHPERLLSVTLGGWDPYNGANAPKTETKPSTIDRDFDASVEWFKSSPYTAGFFEGADLDALRICHAVLFDGQVKTQAIASCSVPKFIFCGDEDAFFEGAERLADEVGAEKFVRFEGADHRTAIGIAPAREALMEFLASVSG